MSKVEFLRSVMAILSSMLLLIFLFPKHYRLSRNFMMWL